MKNIIASLVAAVAVALPVHSDPLKDNEYFTMHSMGCMMLQECTEDVKEVFSMLDISKEYDNWEDFTNVTTEFHNMLILLNQMGVKVYLADQKYFPIGHRGVYHTVSNNFYLNKAFMHRPNVLMTVMRHEGWHAAQDCMAGTIDNNMIAIILPEESVPPVWRDMVEATYPPSAVPWEAEAKWAGLTEGMTAKALKSCAYGTMWEDYEPTPMTREWLEEKGYIK